MPNPKRSKKKMTDAQKKRRSSEREMKKYLKSQKARQAAMSNEQIFIDRFKNRISEYSNESIINLIETYYNPLNVVTMINSETEDMTWMQSFFSSIWNCMRIPNQEYFFKTYLVNKLVQFKSQLGPTSSDGKSLTMDELLEIVRECIPGPLNKFIIIKELILLYFENQTCPMQDGGFGFRDGSQRGGDVDWYTIVMALCIVLMASEPTIREWFMGKEGYKAYLEKEKREAAERKSRREREEFRDLDRNRPCSSGTGCQMERVVRRGKYLYSREKRD